MANYNVQITSGSGSQKMNKGDYTVSVVSAPGFDTTSIDPTTFTATTEGAQGTFTISANGTLTLVVNETGAAGGTPVTSGTIIMTNEAGDVEYGTAVNISSTGEAVFNNVPFETMSGYNLHFKQLTTDDDHTVYEGVIDVNMNTATKTAYVLNNPNTTQTFTLTSADHEGLPVANAVLTMTGV